MVKDHSLPAAPKGTLHQFIARLPKTETHLHIEGALPLELLRSVAPDRYPGRVPPWWSPAHRYASFASFEATLLEHAMLWYTSPERYHQAAAAVFQGLARQNVRYVETSFHLPVVQFIHADGREILDAIRSAAPAGMTVRVFAAMRRVDYTPALAPVIDSLHAWEHLAGVDLHGEESWRLEPWTAPVWRRVAGSGKIIKAHAGELAGAASVREVVETLGVNRVEHGIRAVEDPAVVELLRDRDVTCDTCPISNVRLGIVPSLSEHPLPQLLEAGVRCTVSTDDPFCFGNTLTDEYLALASDMRLSPTALARIARNGFEVALMDETAQASCLAELDAVAGIDPAG